MEIIFFKGKETHSIELWVLVNNVCRTQLNNTWVPRGPYLNSTWVPPKKYVVPCGSHLKSNWHAMCAYTKMLIK